MMRFDDICTTYLSRSRYDGGKKLHEMVLNFDKHCDPVMNFYLKNHFLTSQQAPEGMIHSKKLQKRPHI